jgi:hypothetical protein
MTNAPLSFAHWLATRPPVKGLEPEHVAIIAAALPVDDSTTHLARSPRQLKSLVDAHTKSAVERARLGLVLERLLTAWRMYCSAFNREQRQATARKMESLSA